MLIFQTCQSGEIMGLMGRVSEVMIISIAHRYPSKVQFLITEWDNKTFRSFWIFVRFVQFFDRSSAVCQCIRHITLMTSHFVWASFDELICFPKTHSKVNGRIWNNSGKTHRAIRIRITSSCSGTEANKFTRVLINSTRAQHKKIGVSRLC